MTNDSIKSFAEAMYEIVDGAKEVILESDEVTPAKQRLRQALMKLERLMIEDGFRRSCARN